MGSNPTIPTRICPRCLVEKTLTEDNFHRGSRQGFQQYCKPCRKLFDANYWKANKAKRLEQKKLNRKSFQEWFWSLKTNPCTDCHQVYPPYVMDWDHVAGDKIDEVSSMFRKGMSKKKILAEINKCDLVCANCHRIRTHTQDRPR